MRTGTYLKIAVAAALTAATAAVTPAAVAAPDTAARPAQAHVPAWHTSQAGTLSNFAMLSDIASVSPTSAWAVGIQHFDGFGQGVLLRWNGRAWQPESAPGLPETYTWNSVDATSAHDVWAYGWSTDHENLAHYDGKRWTEMPLPAGWGYGSKLAAVPGRVWLVSGSAINSYANGVWQTTPLPAGASMNAVEARTSDDAWVAGETLIVGQPRRTLLLHWDGSSWTDLAPADSDVDITDVYQESARSVWATALTPFKAGEVTQRSKVLHWDGSSWTDVTGPVDGPVDGLRANAVTGDGKGTVWISGGRHNGYESTALYWRFRDGVWTSVAGDSVPGGETNYYVINDLAPIGRTGQFWSVGSYQINTGDAPGEYELIQRSTR